MWYRISKYIKINSINIYQIFVKSLIQLFQILENEITGFFPLGLIFLFNFCQFVRSVNLLQNIMSVFVQSFKLYY